MEIKLFNTLSRQLEIFKPLRKGIVSIYTCGPTVYHFAHIGNLRTYVSQDIMKRVFIANGYDVKHIMNITDVGHLTSDSDIGEDKMEKGSKREGKSVWDIAKYYTNIFMSDIEKLNILPATKYTYATKYIKEQIDLILKLEKLGYTYEIEDGIYFDTSKLRDYGKLSGQNLSDLKIGARVEFNENKKNIADFALWKFSPKNEKRQMEWESPWGVGFPGWHIECAAMSLAEIGEYMDIHSGGVDHIKIHHTNEIAEVESVVGHKWVNYWIHMEFLNDLNGKMSKSNGDFLTLAKIENLGYSAIEYRYFLLLASYRKQINFSYTLLDSAKNGYEKLLKKIALLSDDNFVNDSIVNDYKDRILSIVNNDFNTAGVLVLLQDLLKTSINDSTKIKIIEFIDILLGLKFIENVSTLKKSNTEQNIPDEIKKLAVQRQEFQKLKNYQAADELRDKIIFSGYNIIDTKDGFILTMKK